MSDAALATRHSRPLASRRSLSPLTRWRIRWSQIRGKKLSSKRRYLFEEVGPGDVAIDCGANVGLVSQRLIDRGATVHSFEPDPYAAGKLQTRIDGWTDEARGRMHLHRAAVGTEAGSATLFFRDDRDTNPDKACIASSLRADKPNIDAAAGVEVAVIDFVAFVEEFEFVKLLKIDVEGVECELVNALLDAGLHRRIGLMLVETHEQQMPQLREPVAALAARLKRDGIHHVALNWK